MSTRTQKELEQIASLADGMPVGIFMSSAPSGAFVYANHAFHEILGVTSGPGARVDFPAAFGIRTHDGALYPSDRLPFIRALRERADVRIDDIVVHRLDGRRVAVRAFARPLFDAAGAVAYVVIAFTDITEEVEARARADLVERRMQHVLSHAPIILFSFDQQGTVTLSEGRGLDCLGYRPKQLIGRSVFDIYADDPVALMNAYRVLDGEEFTVVNQLGSAALETTFTPVRGAGGEVIGAVGVSVDVTDRVAMQTRLLQAERLASMGTLSATVAHEINNPLTYVLGNLELVAAHLSDCTTTVPAAAQLLQRVNQAREGADRVRRILRGLQAFSRQDDDRAEPTDVHAALERALEMTDNVIRRRARLVRQLGTVPPVLANDLRLGQVFVNLLLNAAQAIPEGQADSNEIRVRTWHDEKNNGVVVAIEDTGCGISPEVRARIFEPFYTTKPIGVGTGLGLSICYGIVDGFGGSIEVVSTLGKGATFSVKLPVSAVGSEGAAIAQPGAASLRRGRLLIVDDDANVARSFALMLGVNHDVELSLEARGAARRILAGERFDVIFCDLMMPGMTGMEFHAIVAANVPEQAERIVFITGGAFTPEARSFVARATNTFLEKPFDMKELHGVLARHVERKATANT
ncbi:MAG: ATP-binding protein [Myxococcota bacterium]|nr:ATP-binding protein [Myxococcota bacterium]